MPALEGQNGEMLWDWAQAKLHSEFNDSLNYTVRPVSKKKYHSSHIPVGFHSCILFNIYLKKFHIQNLTGNTDFIVVELQLVLDCYESCTWQRKCWQKDQVVVCFSAMIYQEAKLDVLRTTFCLALFSCKCLNVRQLQWNGQHRLFTTKSKLEVNYILIMKSYFRPAVANLLYKCINESSKKFAITGLGHLWAISLLPLSFKYPLGMILLSLV